MRKRVFLSIGIIAVLSVIIFAAATVGMLYQQATKDGWEILQLSADYLANGYRQDGVAFLEASQNDDIRVTLILQCGTVVYDSQQSALTMESHLNRTEFEEAQKQGVGKDQRQSITSAERTLYYALQLEDGNVLRVGRDSKTVLAEVQRVLPTLIIVLIVTVLSAALSARWQTARIIEPINQIDLDSPQSGKVYAELSPFVYRIRQQKQEIAAQMQRLEQNKQEFLTISQSMREGLIVTDADLNILTINESALTILGAESEQDGNLQLHRNLTLKRAAEQAVNGEHVEDTITLDARIYRLLAGSTDESGGVKGAVILLLDDTEKIKAEQSRREFSANVSHELKTPLTSISGYAELIKNGIAKPQDVAQFGGKIYDESQHLMRLIQDIIGLSKLDEKDVPAQKETVELSGVARKTMQRFEQQAKEKDTQLELQGDKAYIKAVPAIIEEVAYNLIDNAIRYNKPGGLVTVSTGTAQGESYLRVADTGIGLSAEEKQKVFERFYRADKSHSKEIGGTGLGLAIVKRGVLYHDGRIELESTLGQGSVFTLWFAEVAE